MNGEALLFRVHEWLYLHVLRGQIAAQTSHTSDFGTIPTEKSHVCDTKHVNTMMPRDKKNTISACREPYASPQDLLVGKIINIWPIQGLGRQRLEMAGMPMPKTSRVER